MLLHAARAHASGKRHSGRIPQHDCRSGGSPAAGGGFEISGSALKLNARVPGLDEARFREIAESAKANCPVSKALRAIDITLDISFSQG